MKKRFGFALEERDTDEAWEFSVNAEKRSQRCDDHTDSAKGNDQIEALMEAITHIGGEVSRLRMEMDEFQEEKERLMDSFQRIKDLLTEKGCIDLDEFELACELADKSKDEEGSSAKKLFN